MTSVVANTGSGLQKRVTKERKNQTNNKNNGIVNNSSPNDSNQTNHSSDKLKSDSKLQPTAEQIRIANLMNDKMDDNELKAKVEQIVELTGSSRDDAVVALHDCDNDTAKAIDMILEGESGADSQWRSTGKKKKPPKSTVPLTGDENPKTDLTSNRDSKNEKESKQNANKSEKVNRVGGRGGGPPRMQRAALANRGQRKTKESNNRISGDKHEVEDQNNDIFSSSSQQHNFKTSDTSAPPRRGDRRGRGRGGAGRGGNRGAFSGSAGRGSRTFQNRGLQSNDGFPNSIDTWTNSTADQTSNKTIISTDCNTMTVGNWSDIAANEDWSEEDWEPNHMETKVFTPSTKISEKEEIDVRDMSSNLNPSQTNLSQFMSKSGVESSQPSMSSLLSANISRNPNVTNVAGQTLLQQIQQSSAGQTPTLNQYSLSYNKEATESIKSLVGLTSSTFNSTNSDLLSTNEQDLDSLTNAQTSSITNKGSRLKQTRTSKIPESAVEMPSNDTITALGVHFGTLEFGSESNQFSLGADSSVFQDAVNHVTKTKKPETSSLSTGSMLSQNSDNTYRPSTTNINDSTHKVVSSSIIQNSVLGHQSLTSDSLLDRNSKSSVGQFAHKVLDRNNKSSDYSNQQSVSASDISSTYKSTYSSDTTYNSNNYSNAASGGYPYSSNSQSGYGNQVVTNYSTNFSGTTIGNHSTSNQKLRDIDPNAQHKSYDVSNTMVTNTVGSLGLISNSTVTTNVLKNTLTATGKGVHSVPPGVAATPVLSTPYIVQNTGVPLYPMGIPYDLQFQTTPRDHNFGPYGAQDVKYGRGSESDVIPVSSSQAASQSHNQTFVNTFPPGYGFYLAPGMNMIPAQSIYPTAGPIYPVAQPQNTGSAGSAFGKGNTSYGSHSYNSGYDSISGVAQTQDYVKQSYPQSVQHNKGMSGSNASDLTANNSSIYGKTHSQINKSYDKQSFQATAPAFNLTAGTQSGTLSSTYGAPYVLPHSQQAMLSMSSLQTDVSQTGGTGVGGQRSLSQSHKSSGTGANNYQKYNWN